MPYLAKSPHPNRALGFSSIKQLARSSRIPLTTTRSTGTDPQPIHRLRRQSSLYGTLRDQCTPPESSKSLGNNPHHTYDDRHHSHNSSSDSVTPDQSGLTVGSSSPITPSLAGRNPFYELAATSPLQSKSMGQWQSTIARKPLSVKAKQSLAIIWGGAPVNNDKKMRLMIHRRNQHLGYNPKQSILLYAHYPKSTQKHGI